jgi:Tfp pilus assembly protein PilF
MKRRTVKLILAIFLSIVVAQSTFEIVLQNFFPKNITPDFHQSKYNLPVVLRPNLDVTIDWFHHYLYPPFRLQTNSKHFINDQEFEYEKPKDVFRILVLGSSIFMGLGVKNKELFSKNLEYIFNEKSSGKRIQVINFSGIAWSGINFYTFLKNEGLKYRPDLVIISQGENDFRVGYNNLIEVNKIKKEKLPNGEIKINLEEIKINSLINNPLSIAWEWVRKLPFYLEISKHSQAFYRIRSKVNELWYKKNPRIPKSKQLGKYLETQGINIGKNTKLSIKSDQFSVNPEGHSIIYFAKTYHRNMYEAKANIILHSAVQVKISQLLDRINSKFVVIDVPTRQEVMGVIKPKKTSVLNSSLKNYYYINPTMTFKKVQLNNIETPLYFYNNNHWGPGGNRLASIIAYNFLAKNNLVPTQTAWDLIDPYSPQTIKSLKEANKRIKNYVQTDKRSYKYRGLFYYATGNLILAKENFFQYLKLEKEDYESYYLLGKVLFYLNEFSPALEYLEKSFRGHPLERNNYRKAYMFAKTYQNGWENYKNGNLEKALFFANKLEKFSGEWREHSIFLNHLIYKKMGQLKKTESLIKQALNLWPKSVKFKLIMASLKLEQKKFEDAKDLSQQTLKLKGDNVEALLILGLSHNALGNEKKAKKFLLKHLKLNPNNKPAQKALLALQETEQNQTNPQ